jgi:hypothetical protein
VIAFLDWLYFWVLAPTGLYVLLMPVIRAPLVYWDMHNALREARELNPKTTYSLPSLRSLVRQGPLPDHYARGVSWYGLGRWQVYETGEGHLYVTTALRPKT